MLRHDPCLFEVPVKRRIRAREFDNNCPVIRRGHGFDQPVGPLARFVERRIFRSKVERERNVFGGQRFPVGPCQPVFQRHGPRHQVVAILKALCEAPVDFALHRVVHEERLKHRAALQFDLRGGERVKIFHEGGGDDRHGQRAPLRMSALSCGRARNHCGNCCRGQD